MAVIRRVARRTVVASLAISVILVSATAASSRPAAPLSSGGRQEEAARQIASGAARSETERYELGNAGAIFSSSGTLEGASATNVVFAAPAANSGTFEISDATGAPVFAQAVQEGNVIASFCGTTTSALTLDPKAPVTVWLHAGRCLDARPAVVSAGTVTATFSNAREHRVRRLAESYSASAPAIGVSESGGVVVTLVDFDTGSAGTIAATIDDRLSQDVHGLVVQGGQVLSEFCGRTPRPVSVRPGSNIEVWLLTSDCAGGGASIVTDGVVHVKLTRR